MKVKFIILAFLSVLLFDPSKTLASESFLLSIPDRDISVGESFSVEVSASSPAQAMNAVSGVLQASGGISITGVNKASSIIDFWTASPSIIANQVLFEGIVLSPGYQGQSGKLFTVNLSARKEGVASLFFSDGALLANDGLGSNIIDSLVSKSIRVVKAPVIVDMIPRAPIAVVNPSSTEKIIALPVIIEYSKLVESSSRAYVKGRGEPNALTKLIFKDSSIKSLGEQFVLALQSKKQKPTEALIKNNNDGAFQYLSPENLIAGAYNVTPYLVDEDKQLDKPGFGVQVLVNNSKMVRWLVILINVLALLIPVVSLGVIIYFIPWYSRLRMKILNHKIKIEDEQLNLSEKEIKLKEELVGKT